MLADVNDIQHGDRRTGSRDEPEAAAGPARAGRISIDTSVDHVREHLTSASST